MFERKSMRVYLDINESFLNMILLIYVYLLCRYKALCLCVVCIKNICSSLHKKPSSLHLNV